jgi:putative serine protease PepD
VGVATARPTAFCTRCGVSLVDGLCPEHGDVAVRRGAPSPVPGWGTVAMIVAIVVAVALVGALVISARTASRRERHLSKQAAASGATVKAVSDRVRALEARAANQPDTAAVAKQVEASVVTIEDSQGGVGSGFAMRSTAGTTDIVTDFHVVATDWKTPKKQVKVRQPGVDLVGTITKVDPTADLAIVQVKASLPVLARAPGVPAAGDPVLVVGSPLRLANTVSTGIVSAVRDEFVQFSAPVSPGNSGGPVVDRSGHVIGVTRAKESGNGVEGLSFAIPVAVVCTSLAVC